LRILTFTSLFPSQIDPSYGIFIYQRAAQLAKRNENDVVVISPVPYFPRWLRINRWNKARALPSQERVGDLTVYRPRYFHLPKIFMPFHGVSMFFGCLLQGLKLNREKKIDCIDAHFVYPDGLAAVLLGKVLGKPVTVSARGTDINLYPSFKLIRPQILWTLRQAARVIAVSSALKRVMTALGVSETKVQVIPNGVDPARFQRMAPEEARTRLGLPEQVLLIVSVGALIPSKGHQFVIRALSQVDRRHPEVHLYVLGEGPELGDLERLIEELGLKDRVHLMGKRPNEELPLWFSAATISCLASSREGWPNVVTESLACGTPVVATKVGGIPEILHTPELGILVEQTQESLASGIELALSKNWDRESIGNQTRARTWDAVAAEVARVLEETLR
jgi:teichuronic acid biosynthesis glycosyltransferase TuaC